MVTPTVTCPGYAQDGASGEIRFRRFDNIFEPSGVQQLADGRFIIVQNDVCYSACARREPSQVKQSSSYWKIRRRCSMKMRYHAFLRG